MSTLKMKGTVETVLDTETGKTKKGKEWAKRGFVLNNGDKYNPQVYFSVFGQEKIDDIFNFAEGEEVEVSFNLSSREFNGKYYTQADAWAVEVLGGSTKKKTSKKKAVATEDEDDLDLPF